MSAGIDSLTMYNMNRKAPNTVIFCNEIDFALPSMTTSVFRH